MILQSPKCVATFLQPGGETPVWSQCASVAAHWKNRGERLGSRLMNDEALATTVQDPMSYQTLHIELLESVRLATVQLKRPTGKNRRTLAIRRI